MCMHLINHKSSSVPTTPEPCVPQGEELELRYPSSPLLPLPKKVTKSCFAEKPNSSPIHQTNGGLIQSLRPEKIWEFSLFVYLFIFKCIYLESERQS